MKPGQETIELTPMRRGQSQQVAAEIAGMSRALIEQGLGWDWRSQRILRQLKRPDTIVLIAHRAQEMLGFGIMRYRDPIAHLLLLAVKPKAQRQGVGTALLGWLEGCAKEAGCTEVILEVVASNQVARSFYTAIGFEVQMKMPRYYRDRVTGLRMGKKLMATPAPPLPTSAYTNAARERLRTLRQDFRATLKPGEVQVWDARIDTEAPRSLAALRRESGVEVDELKATEASLSQRWQSWLREA